MISMDYTSKHYRRGMSCTILASRKARTWLMYAFTLDADEAAAVPATAEAAASVPEEGTAERFMMSWTGCGIGSGNGNGSERK